MPYLEPELMQVAIGGSPGDLYDPPPLVSKLPETPLVPAIIRRCELCGLPEHLWDPTQRALAPSTYVLTDVGQQTEECVHDCAPGAAADCDDSGCCCPHHQEPAGEN